METLKFRLVQHDTVHSSPIQEYGSECLMMLIEIINKSSVPYFGSNNNSTGVSLPEILFSFMLEKTVLFAMYQD